MKILQQYQAVPLKNCHELKASISMSYLLFLVHPDTLTNNNSDNFQTSLGYTQLFFPMFVLASGIALSIVITSLERILTYISKTN